MSTMCAKNYTHFHSLLHGIKQIGMICLAVFLSVSLCLASGVSPTATTADCDNATLSTYSGTTNLQANWEPNTIDITWYNGNDVFATNSCVYDDILTLPSGTPTKTGYTFDGWRVKLPTGYTRLQYLESTGSACIDTGVKLSSDNVIYEWNAKDNSNSSTSLFGSEYGSPRLYSGILYGTNSSRNLYSGSSTSMSCGYNSSDGNYHLWSLVISSDKNAYLVKDGTKLTTISWSGTLNKTNTIALYCNHYVDSFTQSAKVSYKYFKIIDNGEEVFHGIPARRNSDNVLGIYDTVSKSFKTNVLSSGSFVAGPVEQ